MIIAHVPDFSQNDSYLKKKKITSGPFSGLEHIPLRIHQGRKYLLFEDGFEILAMMLRLSESSLEDYAAGRALCLDHCIRPPSSISGLSYHFLSIAPPVAMADVARHLTLLPSAQGFSATKAMPASSLSQVHFAWFFRGSLAGWSLSDPQ